MAQARREREKALVQNNSKVKPEHLKLSKTYLLICPLIADS
jgi:hypothetical protein